MAGSTNTYISSLMEPADAQAMGIQKANPDSPPMFYGDVVVQRAIVFPDGTMQTSAAKTTSGAIDVGTF